MQVLSTQTKRFLSNLLAQSLTFGPVRAIAGRRAVDIQSVGSIAKREGGIHPYGTEERFTLEAPECLGEIPDAIELHVGRYRFEKSSLAVLEGCQLVGPTGLVLTSDGRYVLENMLRSESHLLRGVLSTLGSNNAPIRRHGDHPSLETAISLVGPWCEGYFHWFSEWLPRLEGVKEYTDRTGVSPTVLVPPDPPEWMQESLRLVGFDDYVVWDGKRLEVDQLLVPSLRRGHPVDSENEYANAPEGYRWIREQVLENIGKGRSGNPARVLISRRRTDDRRIVNRAEVVALLDQYGFETYELETMAFVDQVALFENADAVVAPHGAGLVNCIYGADTDIVELFGEYVNACYYTMAAGLGMDYGCLKCEPVGSDLRVDIDRLAILLEQILD